jgi:hypothetical protein
VRRADKLTTFMCRLSRNLVASTSWNPKGLSRPVMRLLYLYLLWLYITVYKYKLDTSIKNILLNISKNNSVNTTIFLL